VTPPLLSSETQTEGKKQKLPPLASRQWNSRNNEEKTVSRGKNNRSRGDEETKDTEAMTGSELRLKPEAMKARQKNKAISS
jgi:hypothetical protein